MPKRTSKPPPGSPRAVLFLAATALALFLFGEAALLMRTDAGQIAVARHLGLGDRAHISALIAKHIRRGLEAAGVADDSVHVVSENGEPARWRVGVRHHLSLTRINYAITTAVEEEGGTVLYGRESPNPGGAIVTLGIGLGGRQTHEVELVKGAAPPLRNEAEGGRLALLLYGFDDDVTAAIDFFDLPSPFAVALVPGDRRSADMFRAARAREREVVLHLPLEPLNYPQVNPGPGTILVTMSPSRITTTVGRYLEQAGPVAAVANLTGSLATQDMTVMKAVYEELHRRRVTFLHVAPAAGSVCRSLAAEMGVAYDEPDEIIDGETRQDDVKALDARWNRVIERARKGGSVMVMMRATPMVRGWVVGALASSRLRGVNVVPVSAVLRKPSPL
jgi:polysaccharide deacetylase 2 family uncharacterized protein YibQ